MLHLRGGVSAYRHRPHVAIDGSTAGARNGAKYPDSHGFVLGIERASSAVMPYRIDTFRSQAAVVLAFQGDLDAGALADLRRRIAAAGPRAELVLRAGTEVDPTCLDALRTLPVASLRAESPYLGRWLSEDPS
jgi:hypothetical protein